MERSVAMTEAPVEAHVRKTSALAVDLRGHAQWGFSGKLAALALTLGPATAILSVGVLASGDDVWRLPALAIFVFSLGAVGVAHRAALDLPGVRTRRPGGGERR